MPNPSSWGNLLPAHIMHAEEFLNAVERLKTEHPNGTAEVFDKPTLFLAAHTLELTLKCVALWAGKCECELQVEDGHKLAGPYNRAKSFGKTKPIIRKAEAAVRDNWKELLRDSRLAYLDSVDGFDDGVPFNYEIGQGLPQLKEVIEFLDPLHATDGGALRYVRIGSLACVPVINCFGRNIEVVSQTVIWACHTILNALEGELRC